MWNGLSRSGAGSTSGSRATRSADSTSGVSPLTSTDPEENDGSDAPWISHFPQSGSMMDPVRVSAPSPPTLPQAGVDNGSGEDSPPLARGRREHDPGQIALGLPLLANASARP